MSTARARPSRAAALFARTVGLMNRLTYPRKFLLISVLFGLPLAGQILASTRMANAVGNIFEGIPVEPLALKGFHRPMPATDILPLKDLGP